MFAGIRGSSDRLPFSPCPEGEVHSIPTSQDQLALDDFKRNSNGYHNFCLSEYASNQDSIKPFKQSLDELNVRMAHAAKMGDEQACCQVMKEITIYGLSPDIKTYHSFMHLFLNKMDWQGAFGLFQEMEGKNMPLSEMSSCKLSQLLGENAKYAKALRVRLAAERSQDSSQELKLHLFYMRMAVAGRQVEECHGIMELISTAGLTLTIDIYTLYINLLVQMKMTEEAFEVFKVMRELRMQLDESLRTHLVQLLIQQRNRKNALEVEEYSPPPQNHVLDRTRSAEYSQHN